MSNYTRLVVGHRDPWSPHVLSRSILRALWHSDDHGTSLMTDDGGGLISAWKDLINLTNPTATTTARPTWAATSFDGVRSAVTFDGSANAMATTTFTALPVTTDPGWMFMVGADDSATSDTTSVKSAVGYGTSTTGNGRYLRRLYNGSLSTSALFAGGTGTAPDWNSAAALGTRFMGFAQFLPDGGSANGAVDGRLNGDTTASLVRIGAMNTTSTRLRLGSSIATGASSFWQGKLRTVVIGAGILPLADRQRLEGFYAANSGLQSLLPQEHPYKNAPP